MALTMIISQYNIWTFFSVGGLKDKQKTKLRSPVDPEMIINIYFCFKFERSPLESSKSGVTFWLPRYSTSPRCALIPLLPPPTVFCTCFIYHALGKHVSYFALPILYTGKWWCIRTLHRIWRRTSRKWPHQWSGLFVKSLSFVSVLLYLLILINFSEAKIRLGCFSVGVRSYGFFFKSFKFLNVLVFPDIS